MEGIKRLLIKTAVVVITAIMVVAPVFSVEKALARDTAAENAYFNNKQYYQMIRNSDFIANNSMTVNQIQSFLESKGSALATISSEYLGEEANGRSAAQIIWDAAQANYDAAAGTVSGICIDGRTGSPPSCIKSTVSPRVILITLQKEQRLIEGVPPNLQSRLDKAMGYGCPDGGSCDPKFKGFAKQVGWGAWQLRLNYERSEQGVSGNGVYYKGNVVTLGDGRPENSSTFHPVVLTNSATASLYRYTPWIFFGNYNFWRLGANWFGFTTDFSSSSAVNDTLPASFGTYRSQFTVKGLKATDSRVFYANQEVAGLGTTSWSVTINASIGTHNYIISYRDSGGTEIGTKTVTIERRRSGDINGDGTVDLRDLSVLGESFGTNVADGDWRKLSANGTNEVDLTDLSVFANVWGN